MGVWQEFWDRSFPVGPITRQRDAERDATIARQAELLRQADETITGLKVDLEAVALCADESAQIIVLRGMLAEERRMCLFWEEQAGQLFRALKHIAEVVESDG